MRLQKIFILPVIVVLLIWVANTLGGDTLVKVSRVVDGDTFVIVGGEKVRMIGVDTPETVKPNTPVQPYGQEASKFTKQLLAGKKVRLEYDITQRDKYGRLLAYVYLKDGTFINALLLKKGLARVMTIPPNVAHADEFYQLQKQAREKKVGLWGLKLKQIPQKKQK